MPAKPATKLPNVSASLYQGELQLIFDCVGVETCKHALCPVMPPDGSETCFFAEYGSCSCPSAKYEAMKRLRDLLAKEMVEAAAQEAEA